MCAMVSGHSDAQPDYTQEIHCSLPGAERVLARTPTFTIGGSACSIITWFILSEYRCPTAYDFTSEKISSSAASDDPKPHAELGSAIQFQ